MTASAGPALHDFHREFGDRVRFVTLYVREAHPGENYPQPESLDRKIRHASDYAERDGIGWTVAVDDVTGTLHRALDPKPNSAYFVGADGRVLLRTLWSNDESSFRAGLEAAVRGEQPEDAEREPRLTPMLRGLGMVDEVLEASGEVAQRDLRREAPPMWAMARLARVFRPLTPLGRGIAATAIVGLGLGALVAAAVRLGR